MKILAISKHAEALAELRKLLEGRINGDKLSFLKRSVDALRPDEPGVDAIDLLIIDSADPDSEEMDAVAALTSHYPNLAVLLLCTTRSPDLLISAMRAGIREVLASPVAREELMDAIERTKSRISIVAGDKPQGRVLAFLASKGGSGATFIATNLGYALATRHEKKVLLIDLDFQYGDASFFIADTKPVASVADVARQADRLDATVLSSSCIQVTPEYALLPAPDDPEKMIGLRADDIDRLLTVATENYDFVILDVERSVDALSIRALDRADLIFLVMQPMVPYVRDSQKMLTLFRNLGYPDSKVHLLGNRSDTATDLPAKTIEKTLGMNFYRLLPNDFIHASASANLGAPVLKTAPGSPISRAVRELADDLAGASKNHESWLGRFFRSTHNQTGLLN